MSVQMNQIIAEMAKYPHIFDFDRDGLADRVAETAAVAIFSFMEAETDPDNNRWIELAESYRRWKDRHFPGRKMAELHLLMKDPDQLKGELKVAANELIQTYGLTEEARLEAEWFQEGHQGQNRPARRFYELNDLALLLLGDLFDAQWQTIV